MNRTKVKVRITTISYFNHETESIREHSLLGRFTVVECRKIVRDLNTKNIYVSKETKVDEFEVNTQQLYNLKGK